MTSDEDRPHPTSGILASQIASFQLLEEGFHGITASATLLRCTLKAGGEAVVVCVYRNAIEEGRFAVEPIAVLIDDLTILGEPLAGAKLNGKYVEHMTFETESEDDNDKSEEQGRDTDPINPFDE